MNRNGTCIKLSTFIPYMDKFKIEMERKIIIDNMFPIIFIKDCKIHHVYEICKGFL